MSVAAQIEERAAYFLMRRAEPDWSQEEQAQLDVWLSDSVAHKAAFWRLEHGWAAVDRMAALPQAAVRRPSLFAVRNSWRQMAWAAPLLMAFIAAAVYLSADSHIAVKPRYATLVGANLTIPLPDGSKAQLNSDTSIRTDVTPLRRSVWLDRGEVYFEVAHSISRPFVIHAGSRRVTVLGTRFAVRRDGDRVTVSVLDGRVQLDNTAATSSGSVTVERGGIAVADGTSTLLTMQSVESVEKSLSWRNGILSFDRLTLAEVASEFNRYNRRQLVITDPNIAGIEIGGSFRTTNVDAFIRLLHDDYGLRVEDSGDRTILSR